jgi:hypothetical protein
MQTMDWSKALISIDTDQNCYTNDMDMESALKFLNKPRIFYEAAMNDAKANGTSVEEYPEAIEDAFISAFSSSELLCSESIHYQMINEAITNLMII